MLEVVMRDTDIHKAFARGEIDEGDALAFLARKFKEEHGLSFTETELLDESRFEFSESTCGRAYRVIYKGVVV